MDVIQEISYTVSGSELMVLVPVSAGLIGYMIYWFTQESPGLKRRLERIYGEEQASIRRIISTKYLGAVTLGILPYLAYKIAFPETTMSQLGFGFSKSTMLFTLLCSLGIGSVMALILVLNAGKENIQAKQPEIRVKEWSRKLILSNLLAWAVYLLAYEFFFRGILLFPLVESIGLWPAIAINVSFYAAVHIPKGADEAILAVPFGVILCLVTVATGTIWFAFLVHLIMSWTITLAAIKRNPGMTILKRKS